ncbi:hypothetical protein V8J82_04095 [Gymnodinialimonas sp. 2305UL16-5]|uniref:hypothetical protein n=1 Tax=Gymnodinialimonas mytili TaxID=3126503 RepID=UPI0030B1B408
MKKQRKKPQSKRRSQAGVQQQTETAQVDRRGALRLLRNLAIAAPMIGIAGYVTANRVQASICELDLTKIGDGLPSVVQVHDPQCDLCLTLQRQTRRALRAYDANSHHFLVANLSSLDGQSFARLHNVGSVTLVLLDGDGNQIGVIRGPLTDAALQQAIDAHMQAFG